MDRPGRPDRGKGRPPEAAQQSPTEQQGPPIPEEITGLELDREVKAQLRSLPRATSERVAKHLVAAGQLLEDDPRLALQHAEAARAEGGRLAVVREACGVAAYMAGNYEKTLAELRAARRISGSAAYLPMMADAERGLGRPQRALEFWNSEERELLDQAGKIELRIVAAGARQDLGQPAAAVQLLNVPELRTSEIEPWTVRIRYAYADALLAAGRRDEALEWFAKADQADLEGETDAGGRYVELLDD